MIIGSERKLTFDLFFSLRSFNFTRKFFPIDFFFFQVKKLVFFNSEKASLISGSLNEQKPTPISE